jgi:hypothetical protein
MALQPVECVLVVYYNASAHRATYGRLHDERGTTTYSKDYIQLSRKPEFLNAVKRMFPFTVDAGGTMPLTYEWPTGSTTGAFVLQSADRPHLKWETSLGAPSAWKMAPAPSEGVAETIPGDPTHTDFDAAEQELALLATRGAGQPYLVAVKLRDEPSTLHMRAYLDGADESFAWADLGQTPLDVRALAARTSSTSALAWSLFQSGGEAPSAPVEAGIESLQSAESPGTVIETLGAADGRALAAYLGRPGYGLFFDPKRNHDAWGVPAPLPEDIARSAVQLTLALRDRYPDLPVSDIEAEAAEPDADEVESFRDQILQKDYSVADATSTVKTRGSAQRAFAESVKANYGYRCAVTGIATKEFLVASHIVPWSEDASIRLDPANGICLSLLVDRAFEKGFLLIDDDLTFRVDMGRVGDDAALLGALTPYDGKSLRAPSKDAPNSEYLQRRRALVATGD